ncbi:MAG TPA: 30S ribosome-binding factor RbfA [Rariglobus sp.]|jgi:ribosome-binding factor A|nr:30S ribosome-binding factor RbfA [Rariglobus sp.]
MSTRTLRVNELLQRELSDILRKQYKEEAVAITITGVQVSPDLHEGRVFVAVTGDDEEAAACLRWLKHHSKEFRFELGRRIVLKHMPNFIYLFDTSTERGNRILGVLDEIAAADKARALADESTPKPKE